VVPVPQRSDGARNLSGVKDSGLTASRRPGNDGTRINVSSTLTARPVRQPHQQPYRHHQDGAKQEVAPQPTEGVESHVRNVLDQLFDAVNNFPRIQPDRRQNDPDHDRQQHKPRQHCQRRTTKEAADHVISHGIVILLLQSAHFSTSPAAILRGCLRGAPSIPSFPRSTASSASIRSASQGRLSQRSRLMRGKRIAMPDLCRVERCRPSNATSNTRPWSPSCTTSRTGPNRATVLARTNLSISASSASVKPKYALPTGTSSSPAGPVVQTPKV